MDDVQGSEIFTSKREDLMVQMTHPSQYSLLGSDISWFTTTYSVELHYLHCFPDIGRETVESDI